MLLKYYRYLDDHKLENFFFSLEIAQSRATVVVSSKFTFEINIRKLDKFKNDSLVAKYFLPGAF